jgi:hypothetical protein
MEVTMHKAMLFAVAMLTLVPVAARAADGHVVLSLDQLKRGPAPPVFPKGG